ncbi:MAG: hypothetical protein JNK05_30005 [Myxococcales bacterium]|nr:hypothetical protein [Myxococcales bacterium]
MVDRAAPPQPSAPASTERLPIAVVLRSPHGALVERLAPAVAAIVHLDAMLQWPPESTEARFVVAHAASALLVDLREHAPTVRELAEIERDRAAASAALASITRSRLSAPHALVYVRSLDVTIHCANADLARATPTLDAHTTALARLLGEALSPREHDDARAPVAAVRALTARKQPLR